MASSAENIDIISKIGGLDAFTHIIGYLRPWEKIALRAVCKDFRDIHCMKKHQIDECTFLFYQNYWRQFFQQSVIQLYCRPLIDDTMSFFKYHTLLRVCMDDEQMFPVDALQAIKYLLLYQDEFIKSPYNVDHFSQFAKNVAELEGMYISNRVHSDKLIRFLQDVATNYGRNDCSYFKLLFFNHCSLGNDGMIKMCQAMLNSPKVFDLEILFISNDVTLGDEAMETLFQCIQDKLINLRMLSLRSTGISDEACETIYHFYKCQERDLCRCKTDDSNDANENDGDAETEQKSCEYPVSLNNINLTFNEKISSKGIFRLNELFFLEDETPHKTDCFFNSVAIATSIQLDKDSNVALSSRFRILTR